MEESSSNEPQDKSLSDSIDLSELKSFSFGTEWSKASKSSDRGSSPRSDRSDSRKSRPDRRSGGRPSAGRDRRPPKRKFDDASNQGGPTGGAGERPQQQDGRSGGGRSYGGNRRGGRPVPQAPYESDVFAVSFYPEDNCFATIIKAMRGNHLTYELFEVSKIFLDKSDRFIASVTCKPKGEEKSPKVFVSIPDGMPFASEDEAITHAVSASIEEFFTVEEVEVEAPTGSFPFVNRCSITKVLLGPPNYHKYEQALRDHHKTRLAHLSFEKVQNSVETVREEEAINEWLESMKKASRYVSKLVEEGQEAKIFNSLEEATFFLKTEHRAKLVKSVNYARVAGNVLEKFKETEAAKATMGELQRQRRFPLDTANSIRGRMRREKFSIYKKGAKGVTYVCATKRNFRVPGQVMAESLDRIIRFLDENPKVKQKEMHGLYEEWLKKDAPSEVFDDKKMLRDLHWLIADGYVSHFSDDSLLAQPVMTNVPTDEKKKASPPAAPVAEKAVAAAEIEAEVAPKAKTEVVAEVEAEVAPDAKTEVVAEVEADTKTDVVEAPVEVEASAVQAAPVQETPTEEAPVEEVSKEEPTKEEEEPKA